MSGQSLAASAWPTTAMVASPATVTGCSRAKASTWAHHVKAPGYQVMLIDILMCLDHVYAIQGAVYKKPHNPNGSESQCDEAGIDTSTC